MPFLKKATRAKARASIIPGINTDNGGLGGKLLHELDDEFDEVDDEASCGVEEGKELRRGDEQRDLGRDEGCERDLFRLLRVVLLLLITDV